MSYDDERLAAIYDVDNPAGRDHEYFRSFVDNRKIDTVVDLGCGTGILTVNLTAPGRHVVGIDPAPAMLARAARRPGGGNVEWRLGGGDQIAPTSTDVVIMSGNVAMHIIGDDWHATLRDVAAGLREGGRVAFETRNPLARAWETWNDPVSDRETPVGRLRESLVTDPPDAHGVVTMHCHNEFLDDGDVVDVEQRLQFRTFQEISTDLTGAGFRVVNVWGDWEQRPFTGSPAEPLMVFEATKHPAN